VTSFDWILALIVAASTVSGLMAGFARVTIGLAAGIFGVLFGMWFYRMPAAWFAEYFDSKTASSVLGFLLVFCGILLLGGLLSALMGKIFKWAGLTWLDRLLGAAFGAVRGAIVVAGIVTVVTAFAPNPPPRWMANSQMMPYAAGFARVLAAVAPRELKEQFDVNMDRIRGIWAGNTQPAVPDQKLKKETY